MHIKTVTIIGTGNVANVLGRLLLKKGITIHEIYGRNTKLAEELAIMLQTKVCNNIKHLNINSDLTIICVADNAISEIAAQIQANNIVHTAGSVPMHILHETGDSYGVLYPLQSLRANNTTLPAIPFLINANTPELTEKLIDLGKTIGESAIVCNDEQRKAMHLAAVFANNFTNFMYICAMDICNKHQMPFEIMLPLLYETAHRITPTQLPTVLQTGPAIRGDNATLLKHHEMLLHDEDLKTIYKQLSDAILKRFHIK
jgi:predicted short-subunit dehydrogenase-like oxidoreductase (DUF2520 family)